MPTSRTAVVMLASRALDGQLAADEVEQLAAERRASTRVDAAARSVETGHAELTRLRDAALNAAAMPAEWAERLFVTVRAQFATPRRGRGRRAEVAGRDAAHADDLDLAQSALAGEEHAQREIYFGHIALVQYLLQSRRLAAYRDDIAQDIFFRVFSRLHTYRGDSSLKTWIHRVAINHINNVLTRELPRRARELSESQLDTPEGSASAIEAAVDPGALQDTRVEGAERRAIVHAALSRLPSAARAVVEMKEIDGLTCEEIAELLSVPMGTVQSRLARGRAKLAEYLVADPRALSTR